VEGLAVPGGGDGGLSNRLRRGGGVRFYRQGDRDPVVVDAGLVQVEVGADPCYGVVEDRDEENVPVVECEIPAVVLLAGSH